MRRMCFAAAAALLSTAPDAARAACTLDKLADIPVRMSNHRAMAAVRLNGVDFSMMVDSGAFFTTLSASAADSLHLKLRPDPDHEVMGVGGMAQMQAATLRDFSIAETSLGRADVLVGDWKGGETAGLLGHNVLRIGDVEYDFAAGAIRLMRPRDCGTGAELAYWTKPGAAAVLDIRRPTRLDPHTVATASVNGAPVRVLFDTGAPFSALTPQAAARAGVRIGAPGVTSAGEVAGIGPRRVPSWLATFDSFGIGGETIRHARLRIAEVGVRDIDMLIGADFFLSHRIYVSDERQRMWFTYQGGPVFDLREDAREGNVPPSPPPASPTPPRN